MAWRGLCIVVLHRPCQRIYKVEAVVRRLPFLIILYSLQFFFIRNEAFLIQYAFSLIQNVYQMRANVLHFVLHSEQ